MNAITPSEVSPIQLERPADAVSGAEPASGGFASTLAKAVGSVDQLQQSADQQAGARAGGAGNLHETSIALGEAEVGLHLLMKVRDKVVSAYQQIMQMSI